MDAVSLSLSTLRVVHWIVEHCGDSANSADEQYHDFVRLVTVVDYYAKDFRLRLRAQPYEQQERLRPVWNSLVGGLNRTLQHAEAFLSKYATYGESRNVVQNVTWAWAAQPQVQVLMQRLRDLHAELQSLLRSVDSYALQARSNSTTSIMPMRPIPPSIALRIQRSAFRQSSDMIEDFNSLGETQRLDFAERHRKRGASQANIASELRLVSLLKTQWIVEKLQGVVNPQSPTYSQWSRLADFVHFETAKQPLEPAIVSIIDSLDESVFSVWSPVSERKTFNMLEPADGEKLLCTAQLESQGAEMELLAFRSTAKDTTKLRLAFKTTTSSRNDAQELMINTYKHEFIPSYLLRGTRVELRLTDQVRTLDFKDLGGLFAFQRAFTNYTVMYDQEIVCFSSVGQGTLSRKVLERSKARVQLWCWDPDNEIAECIKVRAAALSSGASRQSYSSILTARTTAATIREVQSVSAVKTHGRSQTQPIVATSLCDPLLLISSRDEKKSHEIWCLNLGGNAEFQSIQQEAKHRDLQFCIRSDSNDPVLRLVSGASKTPGNLGVFARTTQSTTPPHPLLRDKRLVQTKPCQNLFLRFNTADECRKFGGAFSLVMDHQREHESRIVTARNNAVLRAEKAAKSPISAKDWIIGNHITTLLEEAEPAIASPTSLDGRTSVSSQATAATFSSSNYQNILPELPDLPSLEAAMHLHTLHPASVQPAGRYDRPNTFELGVSATAGSYFSSGSNRSSSFSSAAPSSFTSTNIELKPGEGYRYSVGHNEPWRTSLVAEP